MNERVPPRRKQRLRIFGPDDEIVRAAIEAEKAEEAEIDWILRDLVDDLDKEFPWRIYPLAVLQIGLRSCWTWTAPAGPTSS